MSRLLPLLAVLLLALGACGEGGTVNPSEQVETPERTPPPVTETSGGTADADEAGVVVVEMREIEFVPDQVEVDAGTTIRWVNKDPVPHNVVAEEGADFKSDEQIPSGGTYETTVEEPGSIRYVCTIHPGQEGTLVVRDTQG